MREILSIVTVNYHSEEETRSFINSVLRSSENVDFELIVVDNSHSELLELFVTKTDPAVKYLSVGRNLGYAGGMNLGLKHANGEFVFIANNDISLNLVEILAMIETYKKSNNYAVLCPVILNDDKTVQFAGYSKINPFFGRNTTIHAIDISKKITDSAYPHGAAMLISRKNLELIGELSENYFLYYEEIDWGRRIKQLGLKTGVFNHCSIIHSESGSVNKVSQCKLYFLTRNRILFIRKNFNLSIQFVFIIYMLLASIPRLGFYLIKGEMKSVKTIIAALWWHFINDKNSNKLGYGFDELR